MICDGCHKEKEDVRSCLDPYAKEINDEEIDMNLCEDCYQNRCDDI
jgi:hypothetical protein